MMNKQQAQQIIKETFEAPFDKGRFSGFVKNLLNRIDEASFTYQGNYIPDAYKPYIKTLERIGKFNDGENTIDILVITLQKETSLERARTMQRNFVAWYLNGSRGGEMKDAALAAFVSPGEADWRFSLVRMDYKFEKTKTGKMKAREEFTPARRWSFLVGANEKSHTAQSRLVNILVNDEQAPTLKEIENSFDIETVTKEFFLKYRNLFLRTNEELDKVVTQASSLRDEFQAKGVDTVNFAKKLLGQIVFLYFLQKKGWFGAGRDAAWGDGTKHFLRELFKKTHGDYYNFFNDILEPLFYEALRIDRSHDDDYYSRFNCKIPFLNGGLFDPIGNYDWVHTDICLPDKLFSNTNKTKEGDTGDGILDIFDRYNFTVKEDEPLEKEVAIDPELLGKAYEKFNAIRPDNYEEFKAAFKSGKAGEENKFNKKFGVYYTPREIVHYMCQQSLINYLATELSSVIPSEVRNLKEDIETLIHIGEQVSENEVAALIKEQNIKEGIQKTSAYKLELPESIRQHAGLIDQKLADITVCDPAVGSGAFPVGMMNEIVKTRNVLSAFLSLRGTNVTKQSQSDRQEIASLKNTRNDSRIIYQFKRRCIEHSLYGVDIDPGAVEIAKLRLWLSLVVDEEDIKNIKPLPNLDYKIVCGNSLLGVEKNLFNLSLFNDLEKLKPLFFKETNPTRKQEYKKHIDDLIRQITNGHTEFDFVVYFSEVFHQKKGFDVVIANPPYVKEYVNRSAFDGLRNLPCYQGKMDIWYLFACKAIDVAKKYSGLVTFIAHNNWVTSYGASKMRNKVIKEAQILSLIDFGDFKIFEAGIQTMVMLFIKNPDLDNYIFDYRRLHGNYFEINDVTAILNKENNSRAEYLTPQIARTQFVDKTLTFSDSDFQQVLEKIALKANFVLDPRKEVAQGIVCPQDYLNKSNQKVLGGQFKLGDGIFTLSNEELGSLKLSKKELSILLKPYYTTSELHRWWADPQNHKWIIYADSSFKNPGKIKDYPNIKKHLDQFRKVITSDNKPYGLHRARDEYFFKGEKIITVRKCAYPTFTYVDFESYVSATFYVIKTERVNQKYLTGVLNSKLIAFWLKHRGKMQGANYQVDKEPIIALPLLQPSKTEQNKIATLVDKILAITKDDDYLLNPAKQTQVKEYEKKIDQMVYKLYGLTREEIKIVEGVKEKAV